MSDLVVIAFPTEAAAEEVRKKLLDMQQEYLIELGDAVIAVKQPNGGVKLNQLFHPTAAGAVSGAFWGTLIGMIFLMPLVGTALGAAGGALGGALTDVGIDDNFMKEAAQTAVGFPRNSADSDLEKPDFYCWGALCPRRLQRDVAREIGRRRGLNLRSSNLRE